MRLAAAYNGGIGNLSRWKRLQDNRGDRREDALLFIESLPAAETRHFIARLLYSYWMYAERLGQATPSLDLVAQGEWPVYAPPAALAARPAPVARESVQPPPPPPTPAPRGQVASLAAPATPAPVATAAPAPAVSKLPPPPTPGSPPRGPHATLAFQGAAQDAQASTKPVPSSPAHIAILTVSDTRDPASDRSGNALGEMIARDGHRVAARAIVRDEIALIQAQLRAWIADPAIDVVISTGGTGVTGRDVTPRRSSRSTRRRSTASARCSG